MTRPASSGAKTPTEAASPPLYWLTRRAGYGAAPPASRVADAIAARRPTAAPDPGASTAPGRQHRGQARGLPRQARGTPVRNARSDLSESPRFQGIAT